MIPLGMGEPSKEAKLDQRENAWPWPLELLIFGAEAIHWTLAVPFVFVGMIYTYLRLALRGGRPRAKETESVWPTRR